MREITRRNALGIIAASGISATAASAEEKSEITNNYKFESVTRPDLTVINNTRYEHAITVSLRDDTGEQISVLEKELAGIHSSSNVGLHQEAQANVTVPREGVYTVQVKVDGEVTGERSIGFSERGLPDNKSLLIDIDAHGTTIALSVV